MWRTLIGRLRNERGTAVLLALGFMVFLLAVGGFAIDLAYQMSATGEVERSMEAAALAGAGKLWFNSSVFPTVRSWAQDYAGFNPLHNPPNGQIDLDLNDGNDPNGDIVLGIWDGNARSFTPSLDGTRVNAVRCQWNTTVPTSFLRVLGINSLPVSAQAVAWAPQPLTPPQTGCSVPIGLSSCFFNTGGSENSSVGCGATVTFISSSEQSAVSSNSAAWISTCAGCNVNQPSVTSAINDAGSDNCSNVLETGDEVGANNGMLQPSFNALYNNFKQKYQAAVSSGTTYEVYMQDGETLSYSGPGWEVYVPVINTGSSCPPGPISGTHQIVGWTRMVMTQVVNQGGDCAVNNDWKRNEGGNAWDSRCGSCGGEPCGANTGGQVVQALRGAYGYYDCTQWEAAPAPTPGPISALADRLRLVQTQR